MSVDELTDRGLSGSRGERDDPLVIAGEEIGPRLILGTGGAASMSELEEAIRASGAALVTVALRRTVPGLGGAYSTFANEPASVSCPTRPAVLPRAMPCGRRRRRARRSRPTGSSWR